ncbi:MFS transporter [Philodulcilactobacillus myokoensis]|uniref:MFS transporter n=2 Tax=Philodulcilactobacillus myokoensis TaxID=2929573 RepID=A0A9W6B1W3_9LACO|nr:MFS transporter [Philodulcilactobacillus myokoensis]
MHNNLGQSLTVAGIVLFLISSSIMLGSLAGGFLFDNWSPYYSSLFSILLSLASTIILIFYHGWPMFAIMNIIMGFGNGINLTLMNSYASLVKSKSTRFVFNILYVGVNVGVVIGTTMVGYLFKFGITTVFSVAAIFFLVLLLMTIFDLNIDFSDRENHHNVNHHAKKSQSKTGSLSLLLKICAMVLAIYMSYSLWESVMPVHMTNLNISFEKYSIVWTVNGTMIVLLQTLISKMGAAYNLRHQIYLGIVIFGISFIGLIFANKYYEFMLMMVILTFGEMIAIPNIPAWLSSMAPKKDEGKYQGLFNSMMSFGRALGPLYGGILAEDIGYNSLFGLSAFLILGTLLMVILGFRKMKLSK